MSKPQTFTFRATAVKHEQHDGYATTSFMLFSAPSVTDTVTVNSPSELAEALSKWAYSTPLPTTDRRGEPVTVNAWSVSVLKPARWPAGYRQAGERTHTFVQNTQPENPQYAKYYEAQ